MVPSVLSFLLLGLLVPLVKSDTQCNPDQQLPGCKATCTGDTKLSIDISQLFSYPVKNIPSNDPTITYSYNCAGGLYCSDNTENTTAVCENDKVYKGLATPEVVTWTLVQTNPYLVFSVEYGGAEGSGSLSYPSIFVYSEIPGTGAPNVVFNETDPKLRFLVASDCVTLSCEGGGDVSGPIGLALISLSFLALVAYFVVGSLVMYFVRGARGIEVVPNVMFWKDLPFLMKDGVLFMVSPCYKRDGDYEKI